MTLVALAAGYLVYAPLSSAVDDAAHRRALEQRRLNLTRDVQRLCSQFQRFKGRLAADADANEWVEDAKGHYLTTHLTVLGLMR